MVFFLNQIIIIMPLDKFLYWQFWLSIKTSVSYDQNYEVVSTYIHKKRKLKTVRTQKNASFSTKNALILTNFK